jgi:hypothetical protein
MPWVGFEHTIPVFEQAKTVHALDRVAGHCDRLLILVASLNEFNEANVKFYWCFQKQNFIQTIET